MSSSNPKSPSQSSGSISPLSSPVRPVAILPLLLMLLPLLLYLLLCLLQAQPQLLPPVSTPAVTTPTPVRSGPTASEKKLGKSPYLPIGRTSNDELDLDAWEGYMEDTEEKASRVLEVPGLQFGLTDWCVCTYCLGGPVEFREEFLHRMLHTLTYFAPIMVGNP